MKGLRLPVPEHRKVVACPGWLTNSRNRSRVRSWWYRFGVAVVVALDRAAWHQTHFIAVPPRGCYQDQCIKMPAAAPAATRYGSLAFHLRRSPRLTAAMAAAAQLWMI